MNATDPEGDEFYYDLAGDVAGFCSHHHTTGLISGLPDAIGDFSANVSVTDGDPHGLARLHPRRDDHHARVSRRPQSKSWQNGTSYEYDSNATDPEGEGLAYGLAGPAPRSWP